jgi:hypothetical protein
MKEFIYKSKKTIPFFKSLQAFPFWIRSHLDTVKKQGINPSYSYSKNTRIEFVNEFSLYLVFNYLLFSYVYYHHELWPAFFFFLIAALISPLAVLLNQKKYHNLAGSLLHISSSFSIFFGSCSLGREFGIQYFYLPNLGAPFFIFPESEKKFANFNVLFVVFLFLLGEQFDYSIWKVHAFNKNITTIFEIVSFLGAGSFLIFTILLSRNIIKSEERVEREEQKLMKLLQNEILERQKVEESWKKAIQLQTEIMNSIPANAMILDKEGYLLRYNHFSKPFPYYNIKAMTEFHVGINLFEKLELFYKDTSFEIDKFKGFLQDSERLGVNYKKYEFQFTHENSTYWYSLEYNKIDNESFQGSFLLHQDITTWKKIESDFLKTNRIEKALKTALPDLLLNINLEGKIIDFHANRNSSLYMIRDLIIGKNIHDFEIPTNLIQELTDTIQQVVESGNAHIIKYHFMHKTKEYTYEARIAKIDPTEALFFLKKIENHTNRTI